MLKHLLFCALCVIPFLLNAQQIQVRDKQTNKPIPGVAVYNALKTESGATDKNGEVPLWLFKNTKALTFQHLAHKKKTLSIEAIKAASYIVYLEENTDALEEIVLSVSKFGQKKTQVPQQIVSFTSKDIAYTNPQTSADLLEKTGKVFIQKSQLGGGSPLIRGFSTNRLLIAVDGIRFNTAIFRSGNVQNVISIDPFTVHQTEVILGPGSVIYGSDAMGGVLNFYTQNPTFSFTDSTALSGKIVSRYATANQEKTNHISFNVGQKKWAALTQISYSVFDDLRMGTNGPTDYLRTQFVDTSNGQDQIVNNPNPLLQKPTAYNQLNLKQKIRWLPTNHWDFLLGITYTATTDYPRYDRLIRLDNNQLRSAEWVYGPQKGFQTALEINHNANKWYDKKKTIVSYQRFAESRRNRDFGTPTRFENFETVHAWTAASDFSKQLGQTKLFYGGEYVYNLVNSAGFQTNLTNQTTQTATPRYPDGATWQSAAAYTSLQQQYHNKLALHAGLRYNHIWVNAVFPEAFYALPFQNTSLSTGAITGGLGLAWNPNKTVGWKLNVSTAFRAPNIDDIGKVFDSEPGSVVVPNPHLKPEYAYTSDLALSLNFNERVKLEVGTFYTMLTDALVRRNFEVNGQTEIEFQGELSTIQALQNAGTARIYGLETALRIQFTPQLELASQFTITEGTQDELDGTRVPVRHAPPPFGNTQLKFENKRLKLEAFVVYNGQFDFNELAPSQQNNAFLYAKDVDGNPFAPKWHTLNLASSYTLASNWQLNARLENITDQRYRPYASGIAAPGRNLIVAAQYSF